MSVDAVSSSTQSGLVNGGTIKSENSTGSLNMNDFFTLMAAQLQYQDPMNPTDDSQYMSQMAEFGTLEQLTNLSNAYNFTMAAGVAGKKVEYSYWDDSVGKTVTGSGTISAVDVSNLTTPECTVNGQTVALSAITKIYPDSGSSASGSTQA